MRLWFAPQTCARVALTALEEVGVPFETRLIAFMAGEHRQAGFLSINPSGKVPALETPDGVIVQNGAILSYLAQNFRQPSCCRKLKLQYHGREFWLNCSAVPATCIPSLPVSSWRQ